MLGVAVSLTARATSARQCRCRRGFRSGSRGKPQPLGGLSLNVGIRARVGIEATTFAFGHLTVDVRLLAVRMGSLALSLVFGALQSFTFSLGGRPLAFIRG